MAFILFAGLNPEELEMLRFVAQFFAGRGHRTEVVTDGGQALEWIADEAPDVLVTEMMLPQRDGLDLIRELRQRYPHRRTGAILLGVVSAEVGSLLPLLGAHHSMIDAVVIKPVSGDQQRLGPHRPSNYYEQLIISVAHLLYRYGLEPPSPKE